MKAVVFHNVGDIRLDEVKDPNIQDPQDAIIRITSSAICGTDLHFVRGTMPGVEPGTILGHEAVGIVEEAGRLVRNIKVGDRVIIPSTIACGYCVYCRAGYFAQCDHSNPSGPRAGTAFYGGPKTSGPFQGLQAERARIPFANINAVKIPDEISDSEALLLSDIFPTGYFGADIAEIQEGDTVAVFGCGPVGLFAIMSAQLFGAARVLAVDRVPERLNFAQEMGAETIHFEQEKPVETILELTGGIGVDRAIDAVGVDAEPPEKGPGAKEAKQKQEKFREQISEAAPKTNPDGKSWQPGGAPIQALEWAVDGLAKAGTLSIIGVYPQQFTRFPMGMAIGKNLTIQAGNCNHRKYIPRLIQLLQSGVVDVTPILTKTEPLMSAIEAYKAFDQRLSGWIKVELLPAAEESEMPAGAPVH